MGTASPPPPSPGWKDAIQGFGIHFRHLVAMIVPINMVCCLVHFLQTSHGTRDRIWREKRQEKRQTGITTSLAIIIVIKRKHIWVISRDGEVLKGAYIDKLDPPSINQQLLAREFRLPPVHTLVCPVDHIRWTEWNEQGSEIKLWMKGDWEKDEGFRALC